jgi:two-component system, response regulator
MPISFLAYSKGFMASDQPTWRACLGGSSDGKKRCLLLQHTTQRRSIMNVDAVDILLVEDNPYDVEMTVRAFKKHNLVNSIHVVEDGAEALDFIFGCANDRAQGVISRPKLVLLDLKLPKLNGLDVLKKIKTDPRTCTIPVVMVTSSKEDPDIQAAYQLGANSYVVKPVNFDSFMEAMSNLGFYWLLINQSPKNNDKGFKL